MTLTNYNIIIVAGGDQNITSSDITTGNKDAIIETLKEKNQLLLKENIQLEKENLRLKEIIEVLKNGKRN